MSRPGAVRRGVILWDVDGTLLAAGDPDHIGGLRAALGEVAGREVSFEGITLGGSVERRICADALRAAGVAEERITALSEAAIELVGERYERSVRDRRERWLPGVPATVAAVAERHAVGVLTGGARRVARAKLAAARLDHLLAFGAYGDEADDRVELVGLALADGERAGVAWSGRLADVVIVGDTPLDIETARRAGARSLAVATGRWRADELARYGPDALLADLGDADEVLGALRAVLG